MSASTQPFLAPLPSGLFSRRLHHRWGTHLIMRQGLLWLSEQRRVFNFVRRNGLARKFASRFVAGETIEEAVTRRPGAGRAGHHRLARSAGRERDGRGGGGRRAGPVPRRCSIGWRRPGSEVNVSVKLTQMGLDIGEDLCYANMARILDKARQLRGFVRLDMESSDVHPAHPRFLRQRLFRPYGAHCGVVIQSALRRSEKRHRRSDRHESPGAALQGRLPRAPRRWPSPTRPTSTGTTCC